MISIIDADTGKEIHHDNLFDMFITEYQMFDDREYMYVSGWMWAPLPVRVIYHIPTFLTTPGYEPINISCYDQTINRCHPKISLYGCETAKEFVDKKDQIFEDMKIRDDTNLYNTNRTKVTLLRLFLDSDDVVFEGNTKVMLENLLSKDQDRFYIRTWGNTSGNHLTIYDHSLYQEILYTEDNPKEIIPKEIPADLDPNYTGYRCPACHLPVKGTIGGVCFTCHEETVKYRSKAIRCQTSKNDPLTTLIPKIFFSGFVRAIPQEKINFRFVLCSDNSNLTINYYQELSWNGEEPLPHDFGLRRTVPDPNKKPQITITQRSEK